MSVNIWQDGHVEEQPEEPPEVRYIQDVETLRALADPTRLAILDALLKPPWPRVMAAKELAAELGMPQTRLYRHIRQLDEVGLIKVAETRMVSGIMEQRYQATQRDLLFRPEFVRSHVDESMAALHLVVDLFGRGVIASRETDDYKPMMYMADPTIPAEAAKELNRRLRDIVQWLAEVKEDPDGVHVNALLGYYID
jgi:DNA-binding transcriptional ArsR family regulator